MVTHAGDSTTKGNKLGIGYRLELRDNESEWSKEESDRFAKAVYEQYQLILEEHGR